jgi:hypothetical protein
MSPPTSTIIQYSIHHPTNCHALATKDLIISTSTIYDRAEVKGFIAENRVHDPRNIWESFGGFCGAPRKVALVFPAVISDPRWQVM